MVESHSPAHALLNTFFEDFDEKIDFFWGRVLSHHPETEDFAGSRSQAATYFHFVTRRNLKFSGISFY